MLLAIGTFIAGPETDLLDSQWGCHTRPDASSPATITGTPLFTLAFPSPSPAYMIFFRLAREVSADAWLSEGREKMRHTRSRCL